MSHSNQCILPSHPPPPSSQLPLGGLLGWGGLRQLPGGLVRHRHVHTAVPPQRVQRRVLRSGDVPRGAVLLWRQRMRPELCPGLEFHVLILKPRSPVADVDLSNPTPVSNPSHVCNVFDKVPASEMKWNRRHFQMLENAVMLLLLKKLKRSLFTSSALLPTRLPIAWRNARLEQGCGDRKRKVLLVVLVVLLIFYSAIFLSKELGNWQSCGKWTSKHCILCTTKIEKEKPQNLYPPNNNK